MPKFLIYQIQGLSFRSEQLFPNSNAVEPCRLSRSDVTCVRTSSVRLGIASATSQHRFGWASSPWFSSSSFCSLVSSCWPTSRPWTNSTTRKQNMSLSPVPVSKWFERYSVSWLLWVGLCENNDSQCVQGGSSCLGWIMIDGNRAGSTLWVRILSPNLWAKTV